MGDNECASSAWPASSLKCLACVITRLSTANKSDCKTLAINAIGCVSSTVFAQIIESGRLNIHDHDLLEKAVQVSDSRFLSMLLAAGACVEKRERDPAMLLREASIAGFKVLVAQKGLNLNAADKEGSTCLHFVSRGNTCSFAMEAVHMLIAAGADL